MSDVCAVYSVKVEGYVLNYIFQFGGAGGEPAASSVCFIARQRVEQSKPASSVDVGCKTPLIQSVRTGFGVCWVLPSHRMYWRYGHINI